jgi:cytosine deaminase
MSTDLILRNASLADQPGLVDIAIANGTIAAIGPALPHPFPARDLHGALVCAGLIECHIHLDKAHVFDRTAPEPGRLADSVRRTRAIKPAFTVEDVHARAARVLSRAVAHGTTRMRTHVELDPLVDHRGLEGVRRAIADFAAVIDVEICVFPEEGLTNNPGTDELLVAAMETGVRVIGAAPSSDTNRVGQLQRIYEIAARYDAAIDMHVDFGNVPDDLDLETVCRLTDRARLGGRVAIAHITKVSTAPLDRQREIARRLASAGISVAVLPATDLFLMGRDQTDNIRRGVVNANMLIDEGVNATLGTNNIVNGFTPFGDASLVRLANFYAHIAQVSTAAQIGQCWSMITTNAARMLNLSDYGLAPGNPADLVGFDATDPVQAIREIRQPLLAFKRGVQTVEWTKPQLLGGRNPTSAA